MKQVVSKHIVNMTDVDLVQINFTRFFLWMDGGYNSLLRESGNPLSEIVASEHATPVVDARCEYRRPISLDDQFQVRSAIVKIGRSSYVVAHRFEDDDGVFAIGRTTHVWIRLQPSQAPEDVPPWLSDMLNVHFLDDLET
jgi:YbgC/YbaW family acyl-CoA thioester hydrolase